MTVDFYLSADIYFVRWRFILDADFFILIYLCAYTTFFSLHETHQVSKRFRARFRFLSWSGSFFVCMFFASQELMCLCTFIFMLKQKEEKKTFEVASSLSFFFLIPVTTGTRNNHFGVCKVCFLLKKTGAYKNVTSPDQVVAFPWTILWPFCFFCVFFFRNNLCLFYFCIVCV